MRIIAVIPARMAASRFPGKPLAMIRGRTMIEHVYRRTKLCRALDDVLVATCDAEIAERVEGWGGRVVMTSASHERASDRVAEAARQVSGDIVVMVQGDEPLILPEMIDLAVAPLLASGDVECANLVSPISREEEFLDPNTIKVVMDRNGNALYFSREPIPTRTRMPFGDLVVFKQVCVIPFTLRFLFRFTELEPTPLERAESIDMLRALEHGHRVRLVRTDHQTQSVDTPDDLRRVEGLMTRDTLGGAY
jgi:3-deoxy-manno-octulosonate cytidylyltransferase (CMP-KDO synthetase)